jgi:hypothetical protein
VGKRNGPDVEEVLRTLQLEAAPSSQASLLLRVAQKPDRIRTVSLLKDGDRIALLSWMESPDVKNVFAALKDALHTSFSPSVADLRDDTLSAPDRPAVNLLTFRDPAIDEERLLFARVRERLYEVHVAAGKENDVQALMDALTR